MDAKTNRKKNNNGYAAYFKQLTVLTDSRAEIHEWIAFILLLIMAVQPLQGITSIAYTNNEVIALFERRAVLIRALGYISLLNAFVYYVRKVITNGASVLKDTFVKRPWNTIFLLLLVWSFVCVGHAAERAVAIYGDPVRFEGILSYIAYAGFFAGASLVRNENHKKWLFIIMGVTATGLAALSLWCYYHPSPIFLSYMDVNVIDGLSGTFVNTNHFGYYLCTMSTVIFSSIMFVENKLLKLLFAIMGVFLFAVLLVNNTMGSIIAAIAGVGLLLLFSAIIKGGKTKTIALTGIAAILFCVAVFVVFCTKNPEANQLTHDVSRMVYDVKLILTDANSEAAKDAGSFRWGVWRADLALIKDHPWIGCGTDNAYYAIEPYYETPKMPHNEYLNMAVNLGIPAGIAYVAALLSIAIYGLSRLKKQSGESLAAGCCAFTYAVSAFFGVPLCTMLPFFYIFLSFLTSKTEDAE